MEITIELETCKIIVRLDKWNQYAIFISKLQGEPYRLSISQLIMALENAIIYKKTINNIVEEE